MAFEIIDHHTDAGQARLADCRAQGFSGDDAPFVAGRRELSELAGHLHDLRRRLDLGEAAPVGAEALQGSIERLIALAAPSVERPAIASLLRATSLVVDLATLMDDVAPYVRDGAEVERQSRFVADVEARTVHHYVGPHAHRLLAKTRLLGLVPFRAVEALRRMRIRGMGASVAASTYDVLVALGAEDLVFADAARLDPSNASRMPGGVGDFRHCGSAKAHVLARMLQGRNPYARISGIVGRVVPPSSPAGPDDISFDDFVRDADIVVEVVDDPAAKIHARRRLDQAFPGKLLGFIADLGSDPFSAIERPSDKNYFHQNLTAAELERMFHIGDARTADEARHEAVCAVFRMVDADMPPDFTLEFLLAGLAVVPYWSQTPMAARESGAIFAKLLTLQAQGIDVTGKNVHAAGAPVTLSTGMRPEDVATLQRVCREVFGRGSK